MTGCQEISLFYLVLDCLGMVEGRKLKVEELDQLSEEQIGQLYELKQEARKLER
jgi:hypothetical protein